FSRLFRDEIGEAPFLFFLRLRIARAVELLREGMSVTETAVACGFSDFRRFASAFDMHFGMQPHEMFSRTRSA
ncbi:MAG: helix-turn-helix domain-containing protein, partial [Polyangiaceae bacterium]